MWPAWHPQSFSNTHVVAEWHSAIISLLKLREGFFFLKIKKCSYVQTPWETRRLVQFHNDWNLNGLVVTCNQLMGPGLFLLGRTGEEKNSKHPCNHSEDSFAFGSISHFFLNVHFTSKWPKDSSEDYIFFFSWYCKSKLEGKKNKWVKLLKLGEEMRFTGDCGKRWSSMNYGNKWGSLGIVGRREVNHWKLWEEVRFKFLDHLI